MSIQNIQRSLIVVLLLAVFSVSQSVYSQDFECNYIQITDTIDPDTRSVSTNSDGTLLVFVSDQDFTGLNADGNLEIFLYDVNFDFYTQVTDTIGNLNISPKMSSDGSLVVFRSTHDLIGFNVDGNSELFLLKTDTLTLTQLTDSSGGGSTANDNPIINSKGTHMAFHSNRDYTGGNADGNQEVFLLDLMSLVITQITDTTVISHSDRPAISADGTQVSFQSEGNLTGNNVDLSEELFLYDANTDTTTQVTESTDSTFQSNRFSSFSPDGTLITFKSNLDLTGENPSGNEIFLYDIVTDSITQITTSIFPDGIPTFSADGNYVIFSSEKDITGGNSDLNAEIFLYDINDDRFLQYTDTIGGDFGIGSSFDSDLTFMAARTASDITGENPDESVEIFIADCIRILQNDDSSGGGGCSLAPSNNNFADISLFLLIPALLVLRRIIAKINIRSFPLTILLILISLPIFTASCDLDEEGKIKSHDWLVTDGGRGNWQKIALDGSSPLDVIIGDCCHTKRSNACAKQETSLQHAGYFDHAVTNFPHGSTDVFVGANGKWRFRTISKSGRTGWEASDYHYLNSSKVSTLDLRLVDFDGDCRTDVFATWGGKWRVSEDGTGPWKVLRNSNIEVKDLRFGDFNNDGRTDVFSSWGGKWHVSYSGESPWDPINNSAVKVSQLLIADFEGDGRADVFATWDGKWWVSDNGTSPWKSINTSNIKVPYLRIGDFNGDGKADVFTSSGGQWHVSWQGKTPWDTINTSNKPLHTLEFGDFDGNGRTDVFTIVRTP